MYSKVIYEDETKGAQYRVEVRDFNLIEYISFRKFYLDFEGEWQPSKEGITIPTTLESLTALVQAVVEISTHSGFLDYLNEQSKRLSGER